MASLMHLTSHMASKAMTGLFCASYSIPLVARQTRILNSASSTKLRHFFNTYPATSKHHQTLTPIATFRHPITSLRAFHSNRPFNATIPTYARLQFSKPLTTRRMLSTRPPSTVATRHQSFRTPPPRRRYRRKAYTILCLLIGIPVLLFATSPRIFTIILFGSTMIFVSIVAVATGVLVIGLVIPVFLLVTAAALISGIPVSELYFRTRGLITQGFDSKEWEIVDAAENPSLAEFRVPFESEKTESETATMIVRSDKEDASKSRFIMMGDPEAFFRKWYLAVGNVVEKECKRKEEAGSLPLPDRVIVRSKKSLFCKVEIPIDREWVRREIQKDGQAVFERRY